MGQDRRQEGWHTGRCRRHLQVPGRRLPGLPGHERLPLRLRALQHPEPEGDGLRRGVQQAEVGRLSRTRLADLGLRGREHARHPVQEARNGSAGAAAQERRAYRHADRCRAEACP